MQRSHSIRLNKCDDFQDITQTDPICDTCDLYALEDINHIVKQCR